MLRDMEKGTYKGMPTYCTVNAWDCPYFKWDEKGYGRCHIDDPVADCDDFASFFESWEEWEES